MPKDFDALQEEQLDKELKKYCQSSVDLSRGVVKGRPRKYRQNVDKS